MSNKPAMVEMDEFDRRIIAALVEDGRMTVTDLAASVGLSKTPCQVRLSSSTERRLSSSPLTRIGRCCGSSRSSARSRVTGAARAFSAWSASHSRFSPARHQRIAIEPVCVIRLR